MMNPWFEPLKQRTLLDPTWQVTPSWFHSRPRPRWARRPEIHDCWLMGTIWGRPSTLIRTKGSPTGPKLLGRGMPGPTHSTLVARVLGAWISMPQVILRD